MTSVTKVYRCSCGHGPCHLKAKDVSKDAPLPTECLWKGRKHAHWRLVEIRTIV